MKSYEKLQELTRISPEEMERLGPIVRTTHHKLKGVKFFRDYYGDGTCITTIPTQYVK